MTKVSFAQYYLALGIKSQDIQSIMSLICRLSRSCISSYYKASQSRS